jgi:hypothetical protein
MWNMAFPKREHGILGNPYNPLIFGILGDIRMALSHQIHRCDEIFIPHKIQKAAEMSNSMTDHFLVQSSYPEDDRR